MTNNEAARKLLQKLSRGFAAEKHQAAEPNAAWLWERNPRMQEIEAYFTTGEAVLSAAQHAQHRTTGAWRYTAPAP